MACFVVPMAVGIVTTSLRKYIPERYHIDWLNYMLWGGVIMLVVDHIISGEVVMYPPFFTGGFEELLNEMLTVGVPMTITVFVVWLVLVMFSARVSKTHAEV